jgi:RHS repeat-associated protein
MDTKTNFTLNFLIAGICMLLFTCPGYAQADLLYTSYQTSTGSGGNPGGLNRENDGVITGWTAISITNGLTVTNNLSGAVSLPFTFYFYGQNVTQYKVSYNGILSFSTKYTTAPTTLNSALPVTSSAFPAPSIMFWDKYQARGTDDRVYRKTFGTAPNRQHWIKWYASDMDGVVNNYFAIVLEESTNNIYFVDLKKSGASWGTNSATLGLQYSSTKYKQLSSSLSLTSSSANNLYTNNVYYSFSPVTATPLDTLSLSYNGIEELNGAESIMYPLNSSCLTKNLDHAYLFALLNLGDDYTLGQSSSFEAEASVTVNLYNESCTKIYSQDGITLSIDYPRVEQLYKLDISSFTGSDASGYEYSDISYIGISVGLPVCSAQAQSLLNLSVWLDESYDADVASGDYETSSMLTLSAVEQNNGMLTFSWTPACTAYVETYELQVLRLYNQDETITNAEEISSSPIDWGKALSIELSSQTSAQLLMAEGTGYYTYRVRPIGNYYDGGIADSRNWGVWTTHTRTQEGETFEENSTTSLPDYVFYFNQIDPDRLWIYNRAFTENNSIAQGISYATGLGQARQSQRLLHEMDSVLVNELVYDYSGRPAIQSMTAPYNQNHLGYIDLLLQDENTNDNNTLYGPEEFDTDERTSEYLITNGGDDIAATPVWENPLPMFGPIAEYYSDENPDINIPSAGNYPYSRTLYHQDGRVKKQSLFGEEHRMGLYETTYDSGGLQRTVRTYYSAIGDSELIKVFGSETPNAINVYKIIRVDPNETPSVEYKTIDGQTIATAYLNTGQHRLLDDVWNDPTIRVIKKIEGEYQPDPYTIVREQSIAFAEPGVQVSMDYWLNPDEFSANCLAGYCSSCDYTVTAYIIREETDEIKYSESFTIGAESCGRADESLHQERFTLSDPGVYRFGRSIKVNNIKEGEMRYADYHASQIGGQMDNGVLDKFTDLVDYLNGDYLDADGETLSANLDTLNSYLDKLAGLSTRRSSLVHMLETNADGIEVSYDETNDEYSISTSCCSVSIPKVACNEDLCSDYWKTRESMESGIVGSVTFADWQENLFDLYEGYYDFEDALIDEYQSTFGSSSTESLDDFRISEGEELTRYFYDQSGNSIYPAEGWQAVAQISISHGDNIPTECEGQYIFISLNGTSLYYNILQNENSNATDTDLGSETDFPTTRGVVHGLYQVFTGHDLGYSIYQALSSQLESLGYEVSIDGSEDTDKIITITANLAENPSFSTDINLELVTSTEHIISLTDFTVTEPTATSFTYGNGALNSMLNHMMNEDSAYSCVDILSGMETFVENWPNLYAAKGNENYPGPNFLDYLLELCGGKQYSGISNHPYGTSSYDWPSEASTGSDFGYGYLEYAYKSLPLDASISTMSSFNGTIHTSVSVDDQTSDCLDKMGIALSEAPSDWENPDYYADDNLDIATSCGSEAWWQPYSISAGMARVIVDSRDEEMQCKHWEQLYSCIQSTTNASDEIYVLHNMNATEGAFKSLAVERIKDVIAMREGAVRNRVTDNIDFSSFSLSDDDLTTSHALAANSIANSLRASYAMVAMLDTDDSNFEENVQDIQKLFYGDIDVAASSNITENHTRISAFTKTKAQIMAECLNDSLDEYTQSGISNSTISGWIDNIGEKFSMEVASAKNPIRFGETELDANLLGSGSRIGSFAVNDNGNGIELSIINTSQRGTESTTTSNYMGFSDNTSYSIPVMGYKLNSRTAIDNTGNVLRLHTASRQNCNQDNIDYVSAILESELANCRQAEIDSSLAIYTESCTLPASVNDSMIIEYGVDYVHFTLFYYDVAGNLIKTVPPKGVDMIVDADGDSTLDSQPSRNDVKNHTFLSEYQYNSLGQRTYESTPDGGVKEFWYNSIGQLRFSQNEKQAAESSPKYAYLKYDELGRIVEAGISTLDGSAQAFAGNTEDDDYPSTGLSERVVSVYDTEVSGLSYLGSSDDLAQTYLQNRISYTYADADGTLDGTDEIYTYYSYDPHGNVSWMLQSIPDMRNKYIEYEYDLVSGKVTQVNYNPGVNDQFFHKYVYDSDNRIQAVQTSRDGYLWDTDAAYEYYAYGPLKRVSIGEDHIQGTDYVYTINGWLKGMNHQALDPAYDPGADGSATSAYAKDVFGMSLGYFDGDFKRGLNSDNSTDGSLDIYSAFNSEMDNEASAYFNTGKYQHSWYTSSSSANELNNEALPSNEINYRPLFNGSITNYTYNQAVPDGADMQYSGKPLSFMYNYDELYRLTQAGFDYFDTGLSTPEWHRENLSATATYNEYASGYEYDENGNITALTRNNEGNNVELDDLTYFYTGGTNKLRHIHDAISTADNTSDLETQSNDNYSYNETGELTGDDAEGINDIVWMASGKIRAATYSSGKIIFFKYDAMGNRVCKAVYESIFDTSPAVTYYVCDAKGTVMAIYKNTETDDYDYGLSELPLYAGSRIGMFKDDNGINDEVVFDVNAYTRGLGNKKYEINDYLGNVRAVVTDVKEPLSDGSYAATVLSSNDYYPYGMLLPGRNANTNEYRYGYQGKEMDNEIKDKDGSSYDFGARLLDPRVGRWLSMDPLAEEFADMSPYNAMANDPVNMVDPDGREHMAVDEFYRRETAQIETRTTNQGYDNDGDGYYDEHKSYTQTGVTGFSVEFDGRTYLRGKNETWEAALARQASEGAGVVEFGGVPTFFTPTEPIISFSDFSDWRSETEKTVCFYRAQELAESEGNASVSDRDDRIQAYTTDNGVTMQAGEAINTMVSEIEARRTVVVGLDYDPTQYANSSDKSTDHFVTINNYAVVEGKLVFYALENFRGSGVEGSYNQAENNFTVNEDGSITGKTYLGDTRTPYGAYITQVRPNSTK